jgi:biopolymer transport protein ExbD
MVDVAFLLLTFFILTTSLATPKVMELNKPPEGVDTKVNCKKTMVIYLGGENQVYFVAGCDQDNVVTTDFSNKGIRRHLNQEFKTRNDLIITIKPSPECTYGNLVDILDEIKISGAPKYALANWTPVD